ncbi:MAG: cupin domain-containing protein [Pseudomonadota bacterium]
MTAVNLAQKLSQVSDHWAPKIVGMFNGHDIMVVKVEGAFVWHCHPETDDFFLVLEGEIDIELRDQTVRVKAGEFYVVPAGVEHRPVAKSPAQLMLIEPAGTPNTGDAATAVQKIKI